MKTRMGLGELMLRYENALADYGLGTVLGLRACDIFRSSGQTSTGRRARDVSAVVFVAELKKVSVKKPKKTETVSYMSTKAISTIIEQSDVTKSNGLRNRFFMILLYDTGVRIDEMIRIELCDLYILKILVVQKANSSKPIYRGQLYSSTAVLLFHLL